MIKKLTKPNKCEYNVLPGPWVSCIAFFDVIAFRALLSLPEKIKKQQCCRRLFHGMLEIVEPTLQLSCAILHIDDTCTY